MTNDRSSHDVLISRLLAAIDGADLPRPARDVIRTNGSGESVRFDLAYVERQIGIHVGSSDDESHETYEAMRSLGKQGWSFHQVEPADFEPIEMEYVLATLKHCLYGRRGRW